MKEGRRWVWGTAPALSKPAMGAVDGPTLERACADPISYYCGAKRKMNPNS